MLCQALDRASQFSVNLPLASQSQDCKRRMHMLPHVFLSLLVSLLMFALVWLSQRSRSHHSLFPSKAARSSLLPRRLKPRSPLECPACCLASSPSSGGEPAPAPVRPWREIKSRRGAPKRVQSEGFAYPNRACQYSGISDADIHALVGDGVRGQAEQIQRWLSWLLWISLNPPAVLDTLYREQKRRKRVLGWRRTHTDPFEGGV